MDEDQAGPVNTSPFVEFQTRADGQVYAIPKFRWTLEQEQAAADLAEGVYSVCEIAKRAGTYTGALSAWRRHPEFAARVEEHKKAYRELVFGYGLANAATRLQHLQTRHDELRATIAARGEVMSGRYPDIPAMRFGHITEKLTAYGTELRVDTATPALLNDIEKMAAISVGEWNESAPTNVAVQIVCPANLPDLASLPSVKIGSRQI